MNLLRSDSKGIRIFFHILKSPVVYNLMSGYLLFFLLTALLLWILEPSMTSYGTALWYCFVSCTTIGFGDFAAESVLGRILTVLLYIYSVLIIAVITAIFTQLLFEIAKARRNESTILFLDDLERLPELPQERLQEISEKVRELRNK